MGAGLGLSPLALADVCPGLSPGQSCTTQDKSPGIGHSEISQALKMHAGVDFQRSLNMPRGLQD